MAPTGLSWTPLALRFDGSLEGKVDARALAPPSLTLAQDVQFEEVGAVGTRPPFGAVMGGGAIFGGGSLSSCRKLARVNGELCVFTNTGLYSWNAQLSSWVLRGTHLAVAVDETPRFTTTGDQIDGDRAELAGTIVVAWTEAGQVYAGAIDKMTGSVLVSPTVVSTAIGRPRLVALSTKILLFVDDGATNLRVRAIDPATPATAIGGAGTLVASGHLFYDVVAISGVDTCVGAIPKVDLTGYTAFKVTAGLAVTTSVKAARTADGPIAVAVTPDGTKTQVIRGNGTNVQGDLLTTSTLADVFTGQAIGAASVSLNQITAAFSSATSCGVFWSRAESSTGSDGSTNYNTVDTNNTAGTAITLVQHVGLASRAFTAQGHAFVWLAFARQNEATGFPGVSSDNDRAALQNSYFLYRDDAMLVAKAAFDVAGGHASTTGRLPAVTTTSGTGLDFAWCATQRRLIDLGGGDGHTGYAARENIDVTFSFDSNEARRSAAHGQTLYVADSIGLQYDGTGLYEIGFLVYPYRLIIPSLSGGPGRALSSGVYTYKATWRWPNAKGEAERSTTAFATKFTVVSGGLFGINVQTAPLTITKKAAARIAPAAEIWRTKDAGEAFFLASGLDPAVLAGAGNDNGYIPNNATAVQLPADGAFFIFGDNLADGDLGIREVNPENEGVLEALAPPGARIIVPTETRLLLAGIPGDPDAWFYSRERGDGEIASFHDELRVEVPPVGGSITALWADDQFVYVARQTALYAFAGPGKANDDSGQNFTLVRTLSRDVGVVSQEAHAPAGSLGRLVMTSKGWYLVGAGGDMHYVGGAVAAFDGDTVLAVHTVTAKHQVRILTNNRILLWDYRGLIATTNNDPGRWAVWSVADGLDAVMWNGTYVYLTASGPRQESTSFTGLTYGLDVATAHIKPADLFGAVAVRKVQPLGEYRGDHLLRLRMYYNFDDATVVDDVVWNPSPTVVGGPLQFSHGPRRRNCQSFKVRLTAVTDQARATLATVGMVVATGGAPWAATWRAARVATDQAAYGELGNRLTMSVAFAEFDGATIAGLPVTLPFNFVSETGLVEVRDHFAWDPDGERWVEDLDNIGVLVAGTVTVAELEAAIAADTALATLAAADGSPGKVIDVAGVPAIGQFTGGAFGAPTGEALKLTGLGLEVGVVTPGLTRRLPGSQHA